MFIIITSQYTYVFMYTYVVVRLKFVLHIGHMRVVQLLLNRGALLHRDHNGRNPLHLAAMSGYTQTIELLHSVHSHLLDQVDKDGVCETKQTMTQQHRHSHSINNYLLSAISYLIYFH